MESGDLLGERYRLLAPLGRGGTSVVWRGRDKVLARDVAVKLVTTRLAGDRALVSRLRAEAQAAAQLRHPHLVVVYDFGEAPQPDGPPTPYVVLELVTGRSLSDALEHGPTPWPEAVRICAQVAAALAAAHARGIVHRDVKPDNVMLTADGAKLVDFGISATIGESDLGPDGELLCTPAYLAPERLDTGPVRPACDVYGLGLLLYMSLTGELPWQWERLSDLLAAHRRAAPAPLPPLPGLPAEVAQLYRRCLAKRPADRPTSAEAAATLAATAGTVTAAGTETLALTAGEAATTGTPTTAGTAAAADTAALRGTAPAADGHRWLRLPGRGTVLATVGSGRPLGRSGTRRRRRALTAAGLLLVAALLGSRAVLPDDAGPGGGGQQAVACQVRYDVRQDSDGAFRAGVTLTNTNTNTNTDTAPVAGWRLAFDFLADQRVVRSGAGQWRQSGRSVAVEGSGQQAALPAGQPVVLDFEGEYTDANPRPESFQLNGSECTQVLDAATGKADPEPGQYAATPRGSGTRNQGGGSSGAAQRGGHDGNDAPGRGNGPGNGNGTGRGNGNAGG